MKKLSRRVMATIITICLLATMILIGITPASAVDAVTYPLADSTPGGNQFNVTPSIDDETGFIVITNVTPPEGKNAPYYFLSDHSISSGVDFSAETHVAISITFPDGFVAAMQDTDRVRIGLGKGGVDGFQYDLAKAQLKDGLNELVLLKSAFALLATNHPQYGEADWSSITGIRIAMHGAPTQSVYDFMLNKTIILSNVTVVTPVAEPPVVPADPNKSIIPIMDSSVGGNATYTKDVANSAITVIQTSATPGAGGSFYFYADMPGMANVDISARTHVAVSLNIPEGTVAAMTDIDTVMIGFGFEGPDGFRYEFKKSELKDGDNDLVFKLSDVGFPGGKTPAGVDHKDLTKINFFRVALHSTATNATTFAAILNKEFTISNIYAYVPGAAPVKYVLNTSTATPANTTGFNGAFSTEDLPEGVTGAFGVTSSAGAGIVFQTKFTEKLSIDTSKETLKIWIYCSDPTKLDSYQLELSSSGVSDVDEINWLPVLKQGWHEYTLNFKANTAVSGTTFGHADNAASVNFDAIDFARMYFIPKNGELTVRVADWRIVSKSGVGTGDNFNVTAIILVTLVSAMAASITVAVGRKKKS